MKKKYSSGQTLIEMLIAMGIAAIILPALGVGLIATRVSKPQQDQRQAAVEMLRETQEAVRSIRNRGWTVLTSYGNGTFYPAIDTTVNNWKLITGTQTINGLTRKVVITDALRNSVTGAISLTGSPDYSTKQIVVTVSWTTPFPSSVNSTMYLTRYQDNLVQQWTTVADFNGVSPNTSTTTNTAVVNNSGGEVILSAGGGGGDWCQPSKSITAVDLPGQGVANAIRAIEGHVFAGTGQNASGVSFAHVTMSTNINPPIATLAATLNNYKTNGVFGEANYAYITTDNHSQEVVIINLNQYSDPPTDSQYQIAGAIDLPGNISGESISVFNNIAYVTGSDNKLYMYNITSRSGTYSTPLNSSGLALSGMGVKVSVATDSATLKTYAYVMTNATSNQLQIVDVTTPSSPAIVGQITLGTSQTGSSLFVNPSGSRVYAITSYSASSNDFYIINTTNKSSPQIVGSYSTNGMNPKGVTVVTGNRAIVVGTGGTIQYQVINITAETNPVACGPGLSYSTGVYGVDSVLQANGYAYSYIVTGDANAELKIILGGAGGNYSGSGTYISNYLDSSTFGLSQTAFNRYQADFINLSQTTLGFQMAVANAVSGSCANATYTFIGPNKTTSSTDLFTASSGAIPIWSSGSYQNPGQCFKYKVYMSSNDSTQTPELDDFSVNFSP